MKKIAIIGTAGTPARYGGFETLAHHLVEEWNGQYETHVYCSTRFYKKEERVAVWNNARMHYIPLNANGGQSIIYDILSIIHAMFYADALLILGVSGCIMLPFIKWFTNKKIIVNIDGLEWKREKWHPLIKRFLKFSESLAIRYSDADVTDNEAIKRYTSIQYKTLSWLIEYGADHTSGQAIQEADYNDYHFLQQPYAFSVCRIEPENNVHLTLEAFSAQQNIPLVFVGNWNNSAYGSALKKKYQNTQGIYILDAIYDQRKLDMLRSNCSLYVHGHSAGGTNPSLVEAMYLGLPVVAYDVSYNRFTTENCAMYFRDSAELGQMISSIQPDALEKIGEQMQAIALKRYTWKRIGNLYSSIVESFGYAWKRKPVRPYAENLKSKELLAQGLWHLKHMKSYDQQ